MALRFIDLFAGCGGLSLGALRAGFTGEIAIEYQENAFNTLRHNLIHHDQEKVRAKSNISGFDWPSEIPQKHHDIKSFLTENKDYLKSIKGQVDLIVGGPPCQGFSNAGKRKEEDPRNQLYKSYLSFVNLVQPKIILIENVAGIASKFSQSSQSYKDNIISKLKKDYYVDGDLLTSNIFGVPQKRKRYIILGFKKSEFDKKIDISEVFKRIKKDSIVFTSAYKMSIDSKPLNISNTNVYQALSDIDGSRKKIKPYTDANSKSKAFNTYEYSKGKLWPYQQLMRFAKNGAKHPDSHRIGEHQEETKFKYQTLIDITRQNPDRISFNFKPEEFIKAKWKSKKKIINVLKENRPSPTLTTCPFDYIHYKEPRILTVREFARIQSFPDWFEFKGVYALSGSHSYKTPRYSQIGNAVPPLMAESIIKTLKKYL
jgi:DNA (cytosine-5)-methyltransferase 1